MALPLLVSGCVTMFSDNVPSITFAGNTYTSIWPANVRIRPDDVTAIGPADAVQSGDVTGLTVLAIRGVPSGDLVAMPATPATGFPYILFVRSGALTAPDGSQLPLGTIRAICPYLIDPGADGC